MDDHFFTELIVQCQNFADTLYSLKQSGKVICLTQCDVIPYEIFYAHDVIALKLPQWVMHALKEKNDLYETAVKICHFADLMVMPDCCKVIPPEITEKIKVYLIPHYKGYAEDGAVHIHTQLLPILHMLGIPSEYPDDNKLSDAIRQYDEIRKIMRALTTSYVWAFTSSQLDLLCDSAFSLPPHQILTCLRTLYNHVQRMPINESVAYKGLLYKDFSQNIANTTIADISFVEDDSCNGRRQFDISCNYESKNAYYDLLYAYSFKSWCPGMRVVRERIELVYTHLQNAGIEYAVFVESKLDSRMAHVPALYEYCILQGLNAIIVDYLRIEETLNTYRRLLQDRPHFTIHIEMP